MKCVDCQFNLICHAGRLDSWTKDQLHTLVLCPKCNRLGVGQHESFYIFECEQRRFSDAAQAFMAKKIASGEFADLSALSVPDIGPGLIGQLTIGYCLVCLNALPPDTRSLTVKYLDENREELFNAKITRKQKEEAIAADDGFGTPPEESPWQKP